MEAAADARESAEWGRTLGLAYMVGGLFGGRDPAKVVPEKYRPAPAKPRELTPEQREIALEVGVMSLGNALRGMAPAED